MWTPTSLGAGYGATWVQRQDPVTLGWWDIAKTTYEPTAAFDDYEALRNQAEWYRVVVESNLGVRSVPGAPMSCTVTGLGDCVFEMVSNEDPTINGVYPMAMGVDVDLPENVVVSASAGRDAQRLHRSFEKFGEDWNVGLNLVDAVGPNLWRDLVATLRRDVSYVCVLSPWGHRWFAGHTPTKAKASLLARAGGQTSAGVLQSRMVDVQTSPAVVLF